MTTLFELRPLEMAPFHLRELVEAGCFCSGCGRQLRSFSEQEVTRRRFRKPISWTIDGKILISSKLVPALAACGLLTSDDLLPLSPIADLFWLRPSRIVVVDPLRSKISSSDPFDQCGGPINVLRLRESGRDYGAQPPLHVYRDALPPSGFIRTDIEVGNALMKTFLVLVEEQAKNMLEDRLALSGREPSDWVRFFPVVTVARR